MVHVLTNLHTLTSILRIVHTYSTYVCMHVCIYYFNLLAAQLLYLHVQYVLRMLFPFLTPQILVYVCTVRMYSYGIQTLSTAWTATSSTSHWMCSAAAATRWRRPTRWRRSSEKSSESSAMRWRSMVRNLLVCIYWVCMNVCMYVCTMSVQYGLPVCMHCMYVLYVLYVCIVCMYICLYALCRVDVCMHVCIYVCYLFMQSSKYMSKCFLNVRSVNVCTLCSGTTYLNEQFLFDLCIIHTQCAPVFLQQ